MVQYLEPFVPLLVAALDERGTRNLALIELVALMWLDILHQYIRLTRQGITMHALHYNDMVADPQGTLAEVFRYIGWDRGAAVDVAVQAFNRDSQEGTVLSREAMRARGIIDIGSGEWELVRAISHRYPLSATDLQAYGPLVASAALD